MLAFGFVSLHVADQQTFVFLIFLDIKMWILWLSERTQKGSTATLNMRYAEYSNYLSSYFCQFLQSTLSRKDTFGTDIMCPSEGAFYLSELTSETIRVVVRISLLSKTIQPDQSSPCMQEGDGFSAKTLWKKPISFANWLVQQWSGWPVLTNGKRP